MANGNKMTYDDFATYLPNHPFSKEQLEFFEDTFNQIMENRDTSKVTCFADRPGIGKSTFIKAFMHCCIGDLFYCDRNEPHGLIVVTDSIKRLEELSSSEKDRMGAKQYWGKLLDDTVDQHYKDFDRNVIVLRSDLSFMEQLVEQHYKPIVLLSTQRYFMLGDEVREQLFKFSYKGKSMERNTIIFDECPYFSETVTMNSVNLTKIESALYEGLSNQVKEEDKAFAIREFKVFKDRILDQMAEKEKLLENTNITLYWKDDRYTSITPNDTLFFKIIQDNMSALTKQYNSIQKDLRCLQEIASHGAIFQCIKKKKRSTEEYKRSLVTILDHREDFYIGSDRKFFVFDATADIDPRYDLDYVEIVSGEKYNVSLPMTITNIKVQTSKNAVCNSGKMSFATTNILEEYLVEQLKKEGKGRSEILIVTYSSLTKRFKKFENIGYFGNLKGFNDFKDLYDMAHIGMNRFPALTYFCIYCGCHREVYNSLAGMTESESIEFFKNINAYSNNPYEAVMMQTMLRSMLADFEQNVFRLAVRRYENTKKIHVWTFYNNDDKVYGNLSEAIEERYSDKGVVFEYEDAPQKLKVEKVKNRKPPEGKKMTNAQKIIEWCEKKEQGYVFKTKELLNDIGLSNDALKEAKKSNKTVKELFKSMQTDRKGYYKIG